MKKLLDIIKKKLKAIYFIFLSNFIKYFFWNLKPIFKIESHLNHLERYYLYKFSINRKRILEIGSYKGASAFSFAFSQLPSEEKKIICIDTWQNHSMAEGRKDTFEIFKKNIKEYSNIIFPVKGFSNQVENEVLSVCNNYDLLFIDGDHSYEGVISDWRIYSKHLDKNALIILHDTGWAIGVKRVLREEILPLTTEIKKLPNLWIGRLN